LAKLRTQYQRALKNQKSTLLLRGEKVAKLPPLPRDWAKVRPGVPPQSAALRFSAGWQIVRVCGRSVVRVH
jgi:hypothetical protein